MNPSPLRSRVLFSALKSPRNHIVVYRRAGHSGNNVSIVLMLPPTLDGGVKGRVRFQLALLDRLFEPAMESFHHRTGHLLMKPPSPLRQQPFILRTAVARVNLRQRRPNRFAFGEEAILHTWPLAKRLPSHP